MPAISKHLDNIYDSGELQRDATLSILETVQQEGKREVKRKLEYYNLDAVISVGYRVNSTQATQFRIWATQLIKDYIIKGFAMDDERRVYQQITDIFAECSVDYDPRLETTHLLYAHVKVATNLLT